MSVNWMQKQIGEWKNPNEFFGQCSIKADTKDRKIENTATFLTILGRDIFFIGLPWWLSGKESTANSGDVSLIPE